MLTPECLSFTLGDNFCLFLLQIPNSDVNQCLILTKQLFRDFYQVFCLTSLVSGANHLSEVEFQMGKKLYVGNLPFSATEQTLIDTFSQCGTVETAKLITDRDTGRSKGFGFVEMSNDGEAQEAIDKFDGQDCDGRPMKVNEARPMEPRGGGGGGRGGRGGFGGGGGGRGGRGGGGRY